MSVTIRFATTAEVRPLRLEVLRAHTTNKTVDFEGDDDATTRHLVAVDSLGEIVGVSTWLEPALDQQPHLRAVQLRGMATAISVQNQGIGALILAAGVDYALSLDADLIWANARDQALNFYNRNGFVTTGDGFIESVTRLPHHRVIKSLR